MIVGNGTNNSSSHSSVVLPSSSHLHSRPPPAHVTQLTSSPSLGQNQHVVQLHPPPAQQGRESYALPGLQEREAYAIPVTQGREPYPTPAQQGRDQYTAQSLHARDSAYVHQGSRDPTYPTHCREPTYSRHVPMSPHRPTSRSRGHSSRMNISHYPSSLPLMSPSPAHQLLSNNVNSPSLIPQNIPQSFLPQLPLHISPAPRSPQLRVGSPDPSDNVILHPHAFKKLTRPSTRVDDE